MSIQRSIRRTRCRRDGIPWQTHLISRYNLKKNKLGFKKLSIMKKVGRGVSRITHQIRRSFESIFVR